MIPLKKTILLMEDNFSMKRLVDISLFIVAMMMIPGCQIEKDDQMQDNARMRRKVVVNAMMNQQSRTSISAVADGYKVSWNVGDNICLFESAPATTEYVWDAVWSYYSEGLEEGDIVDGKAGFAFEIDERVAEGAVYTYVAGYGPAYEGIHQDYDSAEAEEYKSWADQFEYSGEYVGPHMLIRAGIPFWQRPDKDTFDPQADLMVSEPIVTTQQLSGEVDFSFGRIGTIVKITLTGLNEYAGAVVNMVEFQAGPSFPMCGNVIYDPVLAKYALDKQVEDEMPNGIRAESESFIVAEDGTVEVWLRTLSGILNDWFKINLLISKDDEYVDVTRRVDLSVQGKSIVFPEGKMTKFSVGNWLVADVQEPVVEYVVNDAMDGFTATWEGVEYATGYDCMLVNSSDVSVGLTPVDGEDGTWTVSVANGLAADTYSLYVVPVPESGHALLNPDGSCVTMPIGVPTQWALAHDAFNYWRDGTDCIPVDPENGVYKINAYTLDYVVFKNLKPEYDYSWQVLVSTGDWYMYSTEPFRKIHSIEVCSKDDSYLNLNIYASETPGAESVKLTEFTVVDIYEIKTSIYTHTHKRLRYLFPEDGTYRYYTIKGTGAATLMTDQYTYINFFE